MVNCFKRGLLRLRTSVRGAPGRVSAASRRSAGLLYTGLMLALAAALACAAVPSALYAQSGEQRMDAVLAMDASTSMNTSDKDKLANEAMKLFVDMASASGDKIGLLSYTDQIVREKAMRTIASSTDKEELKAFIDQLARGPYTDLAVGVSEAVKLVESGKEAGRYPLIVLLSDGNNSLRAGRTQEQSDQELQAAVARAKSQGIPIYTIGLNADGQLNKEPLEWMSSETGGKLFVTSTADALPQMLSEIFASHLKLKVVPLASYTADGQFQEVGISIPNGNVMEANISIMSSQPVEVQLSDPAGGQRAVPSDGVVYAKSSAYTMLKLLKPTQGEWKLRVKGASQEAIAINLVYNYDLTLVADALNPAYNPGDTVKVSARLESNGQPVADADLYGGLKGTLYVTDLDVSRTEEIPLTNSGSGFAGSFTLAEAHDYEVRIKVEDASFYRETAPVAITAKPAPSSGTAPAPAPEASEEEQTQLPWSYVAGGALLLAAIVGAVLFAGSRVKRANKGFYGQLVIELIDEDTGEQGSPQYKRLSDFKGKVTLHQLLQLEPGLGDTAQVVLTPGHDSIWIVNRSACVFEKSGRPFDASKAKELRKNERIRIALQTVNKSVWLEYIH